MEGDSLNSGAVGCVGTVKNPIKLARYLPVLSSWRGTLLIVYRAGAGTA